MISTHERARLSVLPTVNIGDLEILNCTLEDGLDLISWIIEFESPAQVVFVNTHVVNKIHRTALSPILRETLKFNDGIGMEIAARLNGCRFAQNLNGTDFLPHLLHRAWSQHWGVYVYGARKTALEAFIQKASALFPGLELSGTDGYSNVPVAHLIDDIRSSGAHILLVALGVPGQELWLNAHLQQTGCLVGIGVGAFIDMYGETIPRAPRIWRSARCEWLWRLIHEPRRLWRRYLVEGPGFLWWTLSNRGG